MKIHVVTVTFFFSTIAVYFHFILCGNLKNKLLPYLNINMNYYWRESVKC